MFYILIFRIFQQAAATIKMSVFKSIKGALSSVQNDITAGFKALTVRSPSESDTPVAVDGIDLNAGADLLNRYQEYWIKMHKLSEENADHAQRVDITVTELFLKYEKENDSMNQLMSLVSSLPEISSEIALLVDKIEGLEAQLEQVNKDLAKLDDICEQVEMHKNKLHHHHQLQMYKEKRNCELEQVKVQLAKEHATRVQGYETRLQEKIRERQEACEEAFNEGLKYYKKHGETQMKPVSTLSHETDLADIKVEDDIEALDEFLGSDDHIEAIRESAKEIEAVDEKDADENDDKEASEDSSFVNVTPDQDVETESFVSVPSSDGDKIPANTLTEQSTT